MSPPRGHRGTATLPLHIGRAPAWLFKRMVELAGVITQAICEEYGPGEMLRRLSDPFWFQAFGCLLGFDWHSSGVTTTVCGALKEAMRRSGHETGLVVCGGKGAASRKTPAEIESACSRTGDDGARLVRCSRLSAKIDSAAVQDGFQVYQHTFFFIPGGDWAVVQQGMNTETRMARRYHWLGSDVGAFASDPHAAVACDRRGRPLNLVASEADTNRQGACELARLKPAALLREIRALLPDDLPLFELSMPRRHTLSPRDIDPSQLGKIAAATYENQPEDYEALLQVPGVGPKTLRALSLAAEIIHAAPASHRDPAAYSFAHGGKDGFPYPVARERYDQTIDLLRQMVGRARISPNPKAEALRRLARFHERLADDRPPARPSGPGEELR